MHYACRIGIGNFKANKSVQMAWLPFKPLSTLNVGNWQQEMDYRLQNAARTFQMNLNYGRADIWRNTGSMKIMSLCCRKTGGSDVCWLGARDMGDLDEHL